LSKKIELITNFDYRSLKILCFFKFYNIKHNQVQFSFLLYSIFNIVLKLRVYRLKKVKQKLKKSIKS